MVLSPCIWQNLGKKKNLHFDSSSKQWPICHTCLTYSFYFSNSFLLLLRSLQRGGLTEQGSIQPEGTVSGRGNLTSCSTQSREYQLPILSEQARHKILTSCLVSLGLMLHHLYKILNIVRHVIEPEIVGLSCSHPPIQYNAAFWGQSPLMNRQN